MTCSFFCSDIAIDFGGGGSKCVDDFETARRFVRLDAGVDIGVDIGVEGCKDCDSSVTVFDFTDFFILRRGVMPSSPISSSISDLFVCRQHVAACVKPEVCDGRGTFLFKY